MTDVGASDISVRRMGAVAIKLIDRSGAIALISQALQSRSGTVFAFCNMHTFNLARRSPALAKALNEAVVFNDGIGIGIASRILFGAGFPDNLNGSDLTPAVLGALDRPTRIFLVGGLTGVAEQAGRTLQSTYPSVTIVGCHDGYFTPAEGEQLADRIRAAETDLLLVGMGNPRQELWSAEIAARAGAVILCVGAFLDFAAGRFPRAPRFVQAIRCEWLYRLALEPKRLAGRYFGGAAPFFWAVLRQRWMGAPSAGRGSSH